jgi:DNA end-binding protein Ku
VIQDPDDGGSAKGSNVIDLMAALKKSLGGADEEVPAKKPVAKARAAPAKKASVKTAPVKPAPARRRA